jgi:hypothetical protein
MQHKHLAIALWVTAVVILVGLFTKSWFTPERGDGGIGLTGVEVCRRDHCQTASWDELRRAPRDINVFAWLGLLGGIGAAGFAAAIGGMVASGKAARIPLKVFNAVLGVAAFSTTMFAMRVFGEMSKDVSFSYSGFLAIGGLIATGAIVQRGVAPLVRAAAVADAAPLTRAAV